MKLPRSAGVFWGAVLLLASVAARGEILEQILVKVNGDILTKSARSRTCASVGSP